MTPGQPARRACASGDRAVNPGDVGTPRQRELIRAFARVNADNGFDDIRLHGDTPVRRRTDWSLFHRFPEVTFTMLSPWRMLAARCFDDLADDLDAGRPPYPRSTCEQIALCLIVEDASRALDIPTAQESLVDLPRRTSDDDWDAILTGLVDRGTINRLYRLPASNHDVDACPDHWLHPFDLQSARDPRRGFRR
jgi:hypothetical protein